jgi:hypothetical protein
MRGFAVSYPTAKVIGCLRVSQPLEGTNRAKPKNRKPLRNPDSQCTTWYMGHNTESGRNAPTLLRCGCYNHVPRIPRTSENRKARKCAVPSKNSRLSANQFEARCARRIDILGADRDTPIPCSAGRMLITHCLTMISLSQFFCLVGSIVVAFSLEW